jgi:hypothetical protein
MNIRISEHVIFNEHFRNYEAVLMCLFIIDQGNPSLNIGTIIGHAITHQLYCSDGIP